MRITLLGTGAAAGLPVYGCLCELCLRAQQTASLRRTACSALLQLGTQQYLIDAGQLDLTQRFAAGSLAGILLTHFHPDHVQGLFHLRWGTNLSIPVHCPPDSQGCADLFKHPGILQFLPARKLESFVLGDAQVTPLPMIHSKPTFGYCIDWREQRVAYLTDTKGLPPASVRFLSQKPIDLLFLDCTYGPEEAMPGHNNYHDALQIKHQLQPRQLILTHIGHGMDNWLLSHGHTLPADVVVARDSMVFDLN